MKIIAIKNGSSAILLDRMFALRAKVFDGRLGWKVLARDGRERDLFDEFDPVYVLAVTARNDVVGCARLLPAMGKTMLSSVFPQLVQDQTFSSHARMVESSRFCVDTTIQRKGRSGLHHVTRLMFAGILEWCLSRGHTEVVTVTDLAVERILGRAGWPLRRLGPVQTVGKGKALAGVLAVDREIFGRVKPHGYMSDLNRFSQHGPTVSS
ncbi:acyl-homoserine-lactone synthase [Ensifer sp.]|jgi:acyl homoserine lactone synthase|uniref:acyl-homoserine-lactone synthase n=1 Tax=Ensifer sp. TaxID=1872086 RepID=UPI002E0DFFF1|nr:acyl-homoserine-lactone synthase [Ensifer sp.]